MEMIQAALSYLEKCNIKVSKTYVSFRIKSHPDYPSLVSLTDTLNELDIKYQAVQVDKSNYMEIDFPFLALTKHKKVSFEIADSIKYCEKDNGSFLNRWEGVAIKVDAGQKVANKRNENILKSEKISSRLQFLYTGGWTAIILLLLLNNFEANHLSFIVLSLLGVVISSLIVLFKLGKTNRLTDAFCSTEADQSCNRVINSKGSKFSGGVDLSDISLVYFTTLSFFSIIIILEGGGGGLLDILAIPCSLGFIISLISIYYQWRVLKSWCKLCLCLSGVLWLEFFIVIGHIYQDGFNNKVFSTDVFLQAALALIIAAGWFLIKPLLQIRNKKEETDIQLEKWKRNPEIFKLLVMDQKVINTDIPDNLFYFGKVKTPLHIAMVTNPYCKPCATAHEILAELFKKNKDDISFSIIFTPGNGPDKGDKKYEAVENILMAAHEDNALEILHEWFQTMNLDKWQSKYRPKPLESNYENLIKNFAEWTALNRPAYTPAIYLNGYLLPKLYNLEDISTFLFDISSGLLKTPSITVRAV